MAKKYHETDCLFRDADRIIAVSKKVKEWAENLELVNEAMRDYWGPRCEEYEPECPCCRAWRALDSVILPL